jgi:hypothetical protein
MRYDGSYSSGWTEDGLQPSGKHHLLIIILLFTHCFIIIGWVVLQYVNLALHQINEV